MSEHYEGGFDLANFFSSFVVNSIMRIVGFATRSLVLLIGLFAYILTSLFFLGVFAIWLLAPALIMGILVLAVTFLIL